MNKKITFIYFDMGGVFFEWSKYFSIAANTFGVDQKQIIALFNANSDAITKGKMSSEQFWEMCQEEFKIKNGKDFSFVESWVNDYVPISEMHEFAQELSHNFRIGIISNIYSGMFPLLIKNGRTPNLSYNVKILSHEVGLQKPEKEIYELAQRKANVKGNEILYIDDSKDYIYSAKQLGWQTVLFDTYNINTSIAAIKQLLI